MNFLNMNIKKILLASLLVALPLLSINMQRNKIELPWILTPISIMAGFINNAYYSFSEGIRGTTALYLDLVNIKKKNRVLLKQNSEFRAQLGELTELRLENQRLNRLLNFKQKTKTELVAAKMIGKDLVPDHSTITINRGAHHGIKKHMAAITVGGVVGYTIRIESFTSHVMLLTDRYATIDAIVQRSRTRGTVEGFSKEFSQLRQLRRNDDVVEGDLIVTSGLFNMFPKGFPIGTVTEIDKNRYGMSQDVTLKPSINPLNLEELFIVVNAKNEDFTPEPKVYPKIKNTQPKEDPKKETPVQ